jgi:hypothetical protein
MIAHPLMPAAASDRERHITEIVRALMCAGLSAERGLAEARRAVELAERVGAAEGVASLRLTSDIIREHIEAVLWLAASRGAVPQDEAGMRAADARGRLGLERREYPQRDLVLEAART